MVIRILDPTFKVFLKESLVFLFFLLPEFPTFLKNFPQYFLWSNFYHKFLIMDQINKSIQSRCGSFKIWVTQSRPESPDHNLKRWFPGPQLELAGKLGLFRCKQKVTPKNPGKFSNSTRFTRRLYLKIL